MILKIKTKAKQKKRERKKIKKRRRNKNKRNQLKRKNYPLKYSIELQFYYQDHMMINPKRENAATVMAKGLLMILTQVKQAFWKKISSIINLDFLPPK